MEITLNDKEYKVPPLSAATLRRMRQVGGCPMADMGPYQIIQTLTAISACCSFDEAGDLWARHREQYGDEAADRAIKQFSNELTDEVNRRIYWFYRRAPALQKKWRKAFETGV